MKKYKFLALISALFLLSACGNQSMTIIDQNGKKVDVAASGGNSYTFQMPEKTDIPTPWVNPFIDVSENNWFYPSVRFCHENKLISGTTETTFSPQIATNRAMIVSILWRLEGCPDTGTNTFSDVDDSEYYADAVAWAASEGIVSGYSEEIFSPETNITREQLASILYRYTDYKIWDSTYDATTLEQFNDADTASSYAVKALTWATTHDILNGLENQLLSPQGEATRAQTTMILQTFCENIII